jgi:bacillopeptidase F (M6 metalloprotease family)
MLFEDNNRVNPIGCSNWRRVPGIENVRDGEIDGWATGSVDLTPYAGMNITLSFRNYNRFDNWYNTYTYLDNIQLVVTP